MATDPRFENARSNGHARRALEDLAVAEDHEGWVARSRVMLTPIAAPSIMGLFGFAIASLRARDGVAVAVHTAWASFWVGWGILQLLVATHVVAAIPLGAASPSFAMWFVVLALVTFWGAVGALAQNLLVFTTLAVLTAASAVTAAGFWAGSLGTVNSGGWLFVISAAAAWLAGGAMVLEHSFGRSILPVGKWSKAANVPGAKVTDPISYPNGMPGLKVGQ